MPSFIIVALIEPSSNHFSRRRSIHLTTAGFQRFLYRVELKVPWYLFSTIIVMLFWSVFEKKQGSMNQERKV